jgi:hypothetical protein
MLRLFTAFMESAPQLVFQLYALIQLHQPADADADAAGGFNNASWAAVSAAASTLSLAWGVAAYCRAVRVGRERRRGAVAAWVSSLVEGVWRFCLLAARIMALVLLCLALQRWALLIFCKYCKVFGYTFKKRRATFPSPAWMSLTKLSLGKSKDVIYKLFLPRESLVGDIPAGNGNVANLFLRCRVRKTNYLKLS